MTIKALIFDLDDTLWPIVPVINAAEAKLHAWLAQAAPAVVARYSIEDLRVRRQALVETDARFSYDLWALRHTLLAQVFDEFDVDVKKADEAMQVFAQERSRVTMYADVMPALNQLRERFVLASISNGFADLQAIGLDQHFSVSLAAHQFGCAKPDPRIFLALLERLQFAPADCMYIGDDLRIDVQGAQQVGMRAAWMNRQAISLDASAYSYVKPDLVLHDLHELVSVLRDQPKQEG